MSDTPPSCGIYPSAADLSNPLVAMAFDLGVATALWPKFEHCHSFHTEKLTSFFRVFLKRLTLRSSKVSKLRFAKARDASGKACFVLQIETGKSAQHAQP